MVTAAIRSKAAILLFVRLFLSVVASIVWGDLCMLWFWETTLCEPSILAIISPVWSTFVLFLCSSIYLRLSVTSHINCIAARWPDKCCLSHSMCLYQAIMTLQFLMTSSKTSLVNRVNQLVNRTPGSRLWITSLAGSAFRTHIESLGKHVWMGGQGVRTLPPEKSQKYRVFLAILVWIP